MKLAVSESSFQTKIIRVKFVKEKKVLSK